MSAPAQIKVRQNYPPGTVETAKIAFSNPTLCCRDALLYYLHKGDGFIGGRGYENH